MRDDELELARVVPDDPASGAARFQDEAVCPHPLPSCSGLSHFSGAVYSGIQLNGDAKNTRPPSLPTTAIGQ